MAADGNIRFQPDDAADVEDDGAIGFAHGIAKRAGAGIIERSNVNRFAAGASGGKLAEAFRAGKSERPVFRQRKLQRHKAGKRNQTG